MKDLRLPVLHPSNEYTLSVTFNNIPNVSLSMSMVAAITAPVMLKVRHLHHFWLIYKLAGRSHDKKKSQLLIARYCQWFVRNSPDHKPLASEDVFF